ncbi:MAG: L,D-transpeptidase [Terriglobales bacterium]
MHLIPDRKLALLEDGQVKKVYPVAVGARRTPSPTGEFKVVNRLVRPTYYCPGQVVPPGAENPLGTRWIGLNQKGYGIHGTNAPKSIGMAASHGCIRTLDLGLGDRGLGSAWRRAERHGQKYTGPSPRANRERAAQDGNSRASGSSGHRVI